MASDCEICSGGFLEEDHPFRICELSVSVVNLNPHQQNLGRTVVVCKRHATELWQLEEQERTEFFKDMVTVARALNIAFKPDKMNYALLGNMWPHLHWHLIPRYKNEPAWGQPICPHNRKERTLSRSEYSDLISKIRRAMSRVSSNPS